MKMGKMYYINIWHHKTGGKNGDEQRMASFSYLGGYDKMECI